MVKLDPMSDKDFEAHKAYFGVGSHVVLIKGAEAGKSPNTGSEFLEFTVVGTNDEEGTVRLYLTDKTADRSRSILGAIAVHNKETEAEKQKVREAFKKITDTDQMTDADFLKKFIDMEAWILTEEDKSAPKPNGGYYLRNNLYSYEPTPRKTTAADYSTEDMLKGEPVDADDVPFK